jgi:hypothetical protein
LVLVVMGGLLAACGSSGPQRYGGLPGFLPKSTIPVNRIVSASATDPKLGIEGDTIAATLHAGHVLITVVGPAVPAEGLTPPPPTTPTTFTVTLAEPAGVVPVDAGAFSIVDGQGQVHQPQIAAGAPAPPAVAPAGQTISFELSAVLATGPGTIRWAPQGSPVASWDFTVEID